MKNFFSIYNSTNYLITIWIEQWTVGKNSSRKSIRIKLNKNKIRYYITWFI